MPVCTRVSLRSRCKPQTDDFKGFFGIVNWKAVQTDEIIELSVCTKRRANLCKPCKPMKSLNIPVQTGIILIIILVIDFRRVHEDDFGVIFG